MFAAEGLPCVTFYGCDCGTCVLLDCVDIPCVDANEG